MSNYVPHHTKKKERLVRREELLLRAIRSGQSRDSLLGLAEDVRLARIRASRAERATCTPPKSNEDTDRVAALNVRITALEAMTPEEVLGQFR